jgi:hypothetical protein
MEDEEALKTSTMVGQLSDLMQNIHNLFADVVVVATALLVNRLWIWLCTRQESGPTSV